MSRSPNITMPAFAARVFARMRCRNCALQLFEGDLIFVGAGRGEDEVAHFSYHVRCPHCETITIVIDTTHTFTTERWWEEIGRWHKQTPPTIGCGNPTAIATAVLGPRPLRRLSISGGYRGDVGPVMLIFRCAAAPFAGVMRLERQNRAILYSHAVTDCIGEMQLPWFGRLPIGSFEFERKTWFKMSPAEIQEIVRDRVFTVIPKPLPTVTTPDKNCRQSESTHLTKSRKTSRRTSRDTG